jgi:hypothetical protein
MWQTTTSVASARKRFSLSRTELRNRTVHGGCRVASDRDGNNEIYVMNVDGSNLRRATNNPANDRSPVFTTDGGAVIFVSDRDGNPELYHVAPEPGVPPLCRLLATHPREVPQPA